MSQYANYDKISETYDQSRKAVGIEIILGFLASMDTPLSDISVLDAGSGTGNYALKLTGKVKHITCADISAGMLNEARKKLAAAKHFSSHEFIQCDISELSLPDERFDAIICNQALHHLDHPKDDFQKQRQFLKHANRMLKTNGLLIINTITHEQLRDGVWWRDIIKPAVDRMAQRFTSVPKLEQMLRETRFILTDRVVPISAINQEKGYFDPNSLRSEAFRNGDSHFSLLSTDETKEALDKIDTMVREGTLSRYILDRDKLRQQLGQFTFFVARKK